MASFYAELQVAGTTYPVRYCDYEFTQATDGRGRVVARVRHGLVRLSLDVPTDSLLLDWAATAYKPLAGRISFGNAKGGAVLETLSWKDGQCVGYQEEFVSGSDAEGAYVCHLTIAAPKLVLTTGGPAGYLSPAPREHGSPLQALVNPFVVPLLNPAPVAVPIAETVVEAVVETTLVTVLAPVALVLALILGTATPAGGPGIPQPPLLPVDPDLLRLHELVAKHAAGTLTKTEEAELIALLGKVKGIHVQTLAELPKFISTSTLGLPTQTITNKFPDEPLPSDGKIISYKLIDGSIKDVNGKRRFDFIVDSNGKLIIGDKHHTIGNRQSVQAAGQIRLNGKGQIRQIDNLSGHYQPNTYETANYPAILQRTGLNVTGATIVTHSMSTNADGMITGIKVVSSKVIK